MSAFEHAVRSQEERLQHDHRLANMVTTTSNAVVHHEMLRDLPTPEGMAQDTTFLQVQTSPLNLNFTLENGFSSNALFHFSLWTNVNKVAQPRMVRAPS